MNLRLCLTCGHVGCCNSSPERHATRHFRETGHPVVRVFEPEQTWAYCYADDATLEELAPQPGEAAPVHYGPP